MNQLWGELVGLRGCRSRGVEVSGFDGKARQCVLGEHLDFEVVAWCLWLLAAAAFLLRVPAPARSATAS